MHYSMYMDCAHTEMCTSLLHLYPFCIAVQNILADCHCQCRDIFLCPHHGDSGYCEFISDFDSALQVDRGREKLQIEVKAEPATHQVYRVLGTLGYQPPEVGKLGEGVNYGAPFDPYGLVWLLVWLSMA